MSNDRWRDTYDAWKLATPPEYVDNHVAFEPERGFMFHDGPNKIVPYYDTMWMILTVDEHGEGLMVVPMNGVSMPLATGLESLVPMLEDMARQALAIIAGSQLGPRPKTLRVARFKRVE